MVLLHGLFLDAMSWCSPLFNVVSIHYNSWARKLPLVSSCLMQSLLQYLYVVEYVSSDPSSSSHLMEPPILILLLLLLLRLVQTSHSQLLSIIDELHGTHIYIISVERHEKHDLLSDSDLESFHLSFLPNSTLDSGAPRLLYSYRYVLSGFAARLTPDELDIVKSKPDFLYAQRNRYYQLATTYTPRWGSCKKSEE